MVENLTLLILGSVVFRRLLEKNNITVVTLSVTVLPNVWTPKPSVDYYWQITQFASHDSR